jgi:hypothetical protein
MTRDAAASAPRTTPYQQPDKQEKGRSSSNPDQVFVRHSRLMLLLQGYAVNMLDFFVVVAGKGIPANP